MSDDLHGSGSSQISSNNRTIHVGDVEFTMVFVEGGTFSMGGSSEQGSYDIEFPVHDVTLSGFYIGETEVTQALWKEIMYTNPSFYKGDSLPVESVSWDDCQEFIQQLNQRTGLLFSLPTEAQWEFAARGGNKSRGYIYSGSDNIADVAWYYENSDEQPQEVKTLHPNELGLYDMSGNVLEWCSDWFGPYSEDDQVNPIGPSEAMYRVMRGGSCFGYAKYCRASYRSYADQNGGYPNRGFRLALLP